MPVRLAATLLRSWRRHVLNEVLKRAERAMKDPFRPPPTGRTPDTVFICGFMVLSGIAGLIVGPSEGHIERFGSGTLVYLWNLGLVVAATMTILGAFWKELILGLFIELLGRITLLTTCLLYLISVWDARPFSSVLLGLVLVAGLVASSAWRIGQLAGYLRWIRVHLDLALDNREETTE